MKKAGPSFTAVVRNELARVSVRRSEERRAELAALARTVGALHVDRLGPSLRFVTRNAAIARRTVSVLKREFGAPVQVAVRHTRRPQEANLYEVRLRGREETLRVARALELLDGDNGLQHAIPETLMSTRGARAAYLRGLFLGTGHIHPPQRGYHLELLLRDEAAAAGCLELMSRLDLQARVAARREGYAVYLRDGDQVARFLSLTGAHAAMLAFEDARAYRDVRGQVNRLINAETANVEKAVSAGLRQVGDIRELMRHGEMDRLSPALRQLAQLRLEYPELSLRELGRQMDPPLSKTAAAHRMRRIQEIAALVREAVQKS